MLKRLLNKNQGFTLIEVVIVLAIAGLIFVIVFLAVSQAQASRRDTQRKSDTDRLRAAVNQYASNNNGNVPSSQANIDSVTTSYVTNFTDPSGSAYTVAYGTTAPTAVANIAYNAGRICSGAAMTATGAGARDFAILGYLERGGVFCVDSR